MRNRMNMNSPARILLVEDTPFLRYAFARLLRLNGYDVMEACDGHEAMECLADGLPDIVVTDLMMPGMGGVELIERLHASRATADIPVLAITADADPQAEHKARAAGAVDILAKPVEMPVLLERLSAVQCARA